MTPNEFSERFDYDPDNDLLGEGGFGKIFKAWDNVRNEYIALKISKVQPNMEEFSLLSEYNRVRDLEHPNIARYMDCQRIKLQGMGTHDIALMKYYEYGNLSQLLNKHTLTIAQKQQIVEGLLDGINYLHRHRPLIIHTDLKPSNILIVERRGFYIPLITDFGISRQARQDDKSYVTNTVGAGTIAYAAPEQWEARELRPNVDLWSYGILAIYVWFNGKKLPFRADDLSISTESGRIEFMKRVVNLDFIPDLKDLPDNFKKIVDACLVVNPANRVRSVEELKDRMGLGGTKSTSDEDTLVLPTKKAKKTATNETDERTKILPKENSPEPPPPQPEEKKPDVLVSPPEPKSNKAVIVAASVVVALVAGGTGWYAMQNRDGILDPKLVEPKIVAVQNPKDTIKLAPPKLTLDSGHKEKPAEKPKAVSSPHAGKKKEVLKKAPPPKTRVTDPNAIYHVVDERPSFPGGESAMRAWIVRNRRTPEAAERSFIAGIVKVSFIVNTDGSRQAINVIKGLGYGCDEEAVRLINAMPSWHPARNDGRLVRASQTINVVFE